MLQYRQLTRGLPGIANAYTLQAEVSGTTPFTFGTPPLVELMVGNDMGTGTAKIDDQHSN